MKGEKFYIKECELNVSEGVEVRVLTNPQLGVGDDFGYWVLVEYMDGPDKGVIETRMATHLTRQEPCQEESGVMFREVPNERTKNISVEDLKAASCSGFGDIQDDLHWHFGCVFKSHHWIDIADHARHLCKEIVPEDSYEEDSLTDDIIKAACAHSATAAIQVMARIIGCDHQVLDHVVSQWYDCPKNDVIGLHGLYEKIKESETFFIEELPKEMEMLRNERKKEEV